MNQVFKGLGVKAEFFLCDRRDELGARFVIRLVKHLRAGLLAELLGIGGRQKRALVMVEPPGHFRRIRKLEVHDDVFVAIEQPGFPGLRGAVRHSREAELGPLVKTFAIEPVKKSRGSSAIKAAIVKAEPDHSHKFGNSLLRFQIAARDWQQSQSRCTRATRLSRGKVPLRWFQNSKPSLSRHLNATVRLPPFA